MRTLALLVATLLCAASAQAQIGGPSGMLPGGSYTLSGNSAYTGANTATGLNSATHSATECGTTLTPAHNNIVCTLSANVTLAAPTFVDGAPYKITFIENNTGGYIVSLPPSGFAVDAPDFLSGNNLLISTAPNTASVVYFDAEPLPSGNVLMVTGISAGITPYTGAPTVPATAGSGTTNTGQSGATTQAIAINLTAGDTLILADTGCGGAGACSVAKPNITGIAGTGIGTCTLTSNTRISGGTSGLGGLEMWECPITASGSAVSITATWAATCYSCTFALLDVHGLNASPDAGIGATVVGSSNTAMSISTTSGTSGKSYLVIASYVWGDTSVTAGSGETVVVNSGGLGWTVEYQIVNSGSAVSSTATQASAALYNASTGAYTP